MSRVPRNILAVSITPTAGINIPNKATTPVIVVGNTKVAHLAISVTPAASIALPLRATTFATVASATKVAAVNTGAAAATTATEGHEPATINATDPGKHAVSIIKIWEFLEQIQTLWKASESIAKAHPGWIGDITAINTVENTVTLDLLVVSSASPWNRVESANAVFAGTTTNTLRSPGALGMALRRVKP